VALRMIAATIHKNEEEQVRQWLEEQNPLAIWSQDVAGDRTVLWMVVEEGQTEPILDWFESRFGRFGEFRAVVLPAEATLPRPQPPADQAQNGGDQANAKRVGRISLEELHDDIEGAAQLNPVLIAMAVLSTLVAIAGLIQNNAAVILGAMVIAPLLGPNLALSLATTLGDLDLARKALRTGLVGIGLPLVIAVVAGLVLPVDPTGEEIALRTYLEPSALIVALASGAAGALAYTTGVSAALIGVMVAVSLLPPLVTCGLLLGAGMWVLAAGAFQLFVANLVSVNLAGVLTFLAQGVRPRRWWEQQRARRATRIALALWSGSLVLLILILVFGRRM